MQRKFLLLGPAIILAVIILSLYFGRQHLKRLPLSAYLSPTKSGTGADWSKPYLQLASENGEPQQLDSGSNQSGEEKSEEEKPKKDEVVWGTSRIADSHRSATRADQCMCRQ
jgi:hypothetical protein